jgi:hypothetical protein
MLWIYAGYCLVYGIAALVFVLVHSSHGHLGNNDLKLFLFGIPIVWLLLGGGEAILAGEGCAKTIGRRLDLGELTRTKLAAAGFCTGLAVTAVVLATYFLFPTSVAMVTVTALLTFYAPILLGTYFGRTCKAK